MKIIFGAHTPLGAPFVVGSHHYSYNLAMLGHHVSHVPFPVVLTDFFRRNIYNWSGLIFESILRKKNLISPSFQSKNLVQDISFSFVPRKIFPKNFFYDKLYAYLVVSKFDKKCDLLVIDHPMQYWLLFRVRAKKIIYRPTDTYAHKNDRNYELFSYLEKLILSKVDAIIATSKIVLDSLDIDTIYRNEKKQLPVHVISNGVDFEYFNQFANFRKVNEKIRLVYMGATDDRFDLEMLLYLAKRFLEYEFVIIGLVSEGFIKIIECQANIVAKGVVEYGKLASELAKCKVGLLLSNNHPANLGRSPMKIYEYAAAGLPVVSTFTPEINSRNEKFIFTYQNQEQAVTAVNKILDNYLILSQEAIKASKIQSWHHKTKSLLEFVK